MKTPLQVGVTGGIGSGKSLVCRIFQCLRVNVYNADDRARQVMADDPILIDQIKEAFGANAYFSDGQVNRAFMAERAFGDPEQLKRLNKLVHPRVQADYMQWVGEMEGQPYVIKEAALIFEAGTSPSLDAVVVVSAPEGLRMKRVLQRDRHRTEANVRDIFQNQMTEEEKLKHADAVIVNDESQLVIPQVLSLHQRFLDFKS